MNSDKKMIFQKTSKNTFLFENIDSEKTINEILGNDIINENIPDFPDVPENEVVRHYLKLSQLNFSVDNGFYPLGSCTMKYNPKINERVAVNPGFLNTHPYFDEKHTQGNLELMYELGEYLKDITGMDAVTLQPVAGAHGEMTGLHIIRKYHEKKGNTHKNIIIMPDSAHGTNPASAALAGFKVVEIPSDEHGCIDIEKLEKVVDENTAGFMVTNPNTLGLYDRNIMKISEIFHKVDAVLYYDGANLNAIMGKVKPGDMGFDIVHMNLHKTFSTPHGGGGPGSGPVTVKKRLAEYLPVPVVEKKEHNYFLNFDKPDSIGRIHSYYGNFQVLVKAYSYIRMLGREGLKKSSEMAVLNANFMAARLKEHYYLPYDRICMHEFVLSAKKIKKDTGVSAMDIAKRLLDYGYHAPTMYFPLIVEEALMIEPTETETVENLEKFCDVLIKIKQECYDNHELLHQAPVSTPIRRTDDVKAARQPKFNFFNDFNND
ncbi:MAG: aminomethyl-transferring glycine dehydrogenase subunit GcvPB [Candidatus Muiribacteriota bacterium]|jgi:glycine dehydrogenase subunit 2